MFRLGTVFVKEVLPFVLKLAPRHRCEFQQGRAHLVPIDDLLSAIREDFFRGVRGALPEKKPRFITAICLASDISVSLVRRSMFSRSHLFADSDAPDELLLARQFRFVQQRVQCLRSRLVQVARLADFAQGVKSGFEIAALPAVAVGFQPLLSCRGVFVCSNSNGAAHLAQRRGGPPFICYSTPFPVLDGAVQRYLAYFAFQHTLGGGTARFRVEDAGEQVRFVKYYLGIAGFVKGNARLARTHFGLALATAGGSGQVSG